MAQNDNAVLTAAVGYIYTAPVGTAPPVPSAISALNLENPASWAATGWTSVGHTSEGDLPEFGFEGGDTEVRNSWQKKKLREVMTEDPVDYLTSQLQQFDGDALELYYGANASATPGVFGVAGTGNTRLERAIFVVIVDGTFRIGFHAHKASIRRDDSISLDTEDFGSLPVRATFLQYQSNLLFSWINITLINATAALPKLKLGGATGGTFTLKIDGRETGAITVSGITAAAIKTALVAVDDGISAAQITVTASGSDYDISIPAVLTVGTNSTTGGTGVTIV